MKIGEKYNRCTLKELAKHVMGGGNKKGIFICECGNKFTTTLSKVKTGHTKSCGCLNKERISDRMDKYSEGDKVGNLIYLHEAGKDNSGGRLANFKCVCGEYFTTRVRNVKSGITKSCGCLKSALLSKAGTKHPPVEYIANGIKKIPTLNKIDADRFWSKVAFTANPNCCWEWSATGERYGGFRIGKAMYKSNRVAYFLHYKEDPKELEVIHSCDNPKCCNPSHLSLGTHWENMQDMAEKGRANNGIIKALSFNYK